MSHVRIYSRQGCHLCDEAEALARALLEDSGHTLEIVDIDADPDLVDRYTVRVPVVEVDGIEVAQYVLDEAALTASLRS